MLGGDAIRMVDERGAPPGRRRPAGPHERPPRADHLPAAGRRRRRVAAGARHRRPPSRRRAVLRRVRGRARARWRCSGSRCRPRSPARRRPPRRASRARSAQRRRRRAGVVLPAVLDPLRVELGRGRHRRHPAVRRAGRPRPASRSCSSARQRRPTPPTAAPTPPPRRSRSIRSTCRPTTCEDFVGGGRPRRRCGDEPRAAARGGWPAPRTSTGARCAR